MQRIGFRSIATSSGVAREEACDLEVIDFNFDCEVPFLLIQANITHSQDGIEPGGLKRESCHRVLPLHPKLFRLGLDNYVERVADEQGYDVGNVGPIFPELYCDEAKLTAIDEIAPVKGGKRFYAVVWCFLMDSTHAVNPLIETKGGKKAEFHSHRTFNMSVIASAGVSQSVIDKHMRHTLKGTEPCNCLQRNLPSRKGRRAKEAVGHLGAVNAECH